MDLEREAWLTRMSQELLRLTEDHHDRSRLSMDDAELLRQHIRDYLAHELPAQQPGHGPGNRDLADALDYAAGAPSLKDSPPLVAWLHMAAARLRLADTAGTHRESERVPERYREG